MILTMIFNMPEASIRYVAMVINAETARKSTRQWVNF
jgi:hypothetical protein